jgi:tripartite-type tricarboxylate transporter receptor subunit TctC
MIARATVILLSHLLAMSALTAPSALAQADDYPNRPMTIVAPAAPECTARMRG